MISQVIWLIFITWPTPDRTSSANFVHLHTPRNGVLHLLTIVSMSSVATAVCRRVGGFPRATTRKPRPFAGLFASMAALLIESRFVWSATLDRRIHGVNIRLSRIIPSLAIPTR